MVQEEQFDAIIVGAGFSGINQLIELRRLGLRCRIIETGSDFGGTWYWNRYPGARVDSQVPVYQLALPELWNEWTWTERYPGWRELQAYIAYVAEKLDLHPHCRFDMTVKQAHWDDQSHVWHVTAEGMQGCYRASARYLILCMGFASKPYIPNIKGRETFKGPCCHTSRWPKEGIETTGKRVGVIGTGASGVQVIQEIAPKAAHLTVFQRTPNMALPMKQYSMSKKMQDDSKSTYEEMFKNLPMTNHGSLGERIPRPLPIDSEEVREANFERLWDSGGLHFWANNYQDMLLQKASNEVVYAFWRKKVSGRIRDPMKCNLLAPAVEPHPFGTKRPSLEQGFYEVFNQENVDLVDTKATPILEIYKDGLKMADKQHEFDVLIFATGFDIYGGFNEIDLRGLHGETIQDHWKDGVTTYLGLTIDNFPNLFFMYGPQGPTALCNAHTCSRIQGAWIAQTIEYLREHCLTKFTPRAHAALTFKKHIDDMCGATLFPLVDGWYMGTNMPGRKREAYSYVGGVMAYTQEIMAEIERGYPGFHQETLKLGED